MIPEIFSEIYPKLPKLTFEIISEMFPEVIIEIIPECNPEQGAMKFRQFLHYQKFIV